MKTYTFDELVSALNAIAPYDWAGFFHERLDSTSPEAPVGGIENGGWKVVYNGEPSKLTGRRGNPGRYLLHRPAAGERRHGERLDRRQSRL